MKNLQEYIEESLLDDIDDLENKLDATMAIKDTIGYKFDVEYVSDSNNCGKTGTGMIDKNKVAAAGFKYIKLDKLRKKPSDVYKYTSSFEYRYEDETTKYSKKGVTRKVKNPDPGVKMIVNLLLSLPSDIFYNVPSGLGNVTLDLEKEGVKEIFDQIKPCLDITDNCNIKVLLSEWKGTTFLKIETVRGREPHYYKRFTLILKNK